MAKIVVSDSLIRKPPPLAELDEEYRAELKEWMGGVVSITDHEAPSVLPLHQCYKPASNKENKLPCKRSIPLSLSLNKTCYKKAWQPV